MTKKLHTGKWGRRVEWEVCQDRHLFKDHKKKQAMSLRVIVSETVVLMTIISMEVIGDRMALNLLRTSQLVAHLIVATVGIVPTDLGRFGGEIRVKNEVC